jgi:hypothetical protein
MLVYFLLFTVGGFVIDSLSRSSKLSILICIGIALFWSTMYGPHWAIVSFGEMMLGLGVRRVVAQNE